MTQLLAPVGQSHPTTLGTLPLVLANNIESSLDVDVITLEVGSVGTDAADGMAKLVDTICSLSSNHQKGN